MEIYSASIFYICFLIEEGDEKINKVMCILSEKKCDEGHKKRIDFLKHIDLVLAIEGPNESTLILIGLIRLNQHVKVYIT